MKLIAKIGVGMVQVLSDSHERLIERQAGFYADDGEIQSIGKRDADSLLAVFNHALKKKRGRKKPRAGMHTSKGMLLKPEKTMTPANPSAASARRAPK